jgi:hypothetical protein
VTHVRKPTPGVAIKSPQLIDIQKPSFGIRFAEQHRPTRQIPPQDGAAAPVNLIREVLVAGLGSSGTRLLA